MIQTVLWVCVMRGRGQHRRLMDAQEPTSVFSYSTCACPCPPPATYSLKFLSGRDTFFSAWRDRAESLCVCVWGGAVGGGGGQEEGRVASGEARLLDASAAALSDGEGSRAWEGKVGSRRLAANEAPR